MRTAIIMAMVLAGGLAANQADQSAERIYNTRMQDPVWKLDYTGENFAWHAASGMGSFLEGYEATGNTAYLDWGVKYYDAVLAKMAEGPDGYKGWIGPYIYNAKRWCDCHVGDAILFDPILDFAYPVERDPKLKAKYGAKAQGYAKLAKRDFFEKWDARGTWHEDGPYGVYVQWDKFGEPGQYKNWTVMGSAGDSDSEATIPFNKQIDAGLVALRIWQITGEKKYKQRAEKIFGFMKSRMQRYKDELHWNYWEPGGQWDLGTGRRAIHWVGVHPERNYQSGEVVNILKAYNGGIVFTEEDIRSIVNTNLKMMWNGNTSKPLFANSNADLKGAMTPAAYAGQHAGELWGPLAQVDGTARGLYAARMGGRQGLGAEYFRNVTAKAPPSYQRRDVRGKAEIPRAYARFPLGNVRTVQMGAAMPGIFASGEKTVLICKLIEPGNLEVALYSRDGKAKLATLREGQEKGGADGQAGVLYFAFDGRDPSNGKAFPPGEYRVRWSVAGDGYREYPITIQRAGR